MAEQMDTIARQVLETKLARIRADLGVLAAGRQAQASASRPQYGKRVGDHISEALEERRNVAAEHTLTREEQEVVRALAKCDEGTYGRCDRCGNPIDEERLAALPWAVLCIACQRQAERLRR